MAIRKDVLPKKLSDLIACLFIITIIPVSAYYEMFIVMPSVCRPGGFWYYFHLVIASFIVFNISTNLMALIMCDTSIRSLVLPSKLLPEWRFCSVCEAIAPPRSWHCETCNTCILKRDHHCIFSACCVGHNNHRYFIMFVIYFFIGTVYASVFNNLFIWTQFRFTSYFSFLQFIFPVAMVFVELSSQQFHLLMYLLLMIGSVLSGLLSFYHGNLILSGTTCNERNKKKKIYDFGPINNLKIVLGKRWYLTWVSPLVTSQLPQDGIHWETRNTWKRK